MKDVLMQIIKYGLVGIVNTLLTAVIIWIVLFLFSGINNRTPLPVSILFLANALGYTAGLISSFVLNRNWTFESKANGKNSFVRFFLVFLLCYSIQLVVVWWLNKEVPGISAYVCQLVGMAVYAVLNFTLNKYYTFGYKNAL